MLIGKHLPNLHVFRKPVICVASVQTWLNLRIFRRLWLSCSAVDVGSHELEILSGEFWQAINLLPEAVQFLLALPF